MKAAPTVNGSLEVTGEKFPLNESGYVYIDLNGDELSGWNEPYGYVYSDAIGHFQVSLNIPADVPVGSYQIRFDSNSSYGELYVKPLPITIR